MLACKLYVCVSGDKGDSVGCPGVPGDKGHPGFTLLNGDKLSLSYFGSLRKETQIYVTWLFLALQAFLDLQETLGHLALLELQDRKVAKDTQVSKDSLVNQV